MDEFSGAVQSFKVVFEILIYPLGAMLMFYIKKSINKVDELEDRMSETEKSIEVLDERVSNIKEDISEIKQGIRELLSKK